MYHVCLRRELRRAIPVPRALSLSLSPYFLLPERQQLRAATKQLYQLTTSHLSIKPLAAASANFLLLRSDSTWRSDDDPQILKDVSRSDLVRPLMEVGHGIHHSTQGRRFRTRQQQRPLFSGQGEGRHQRRLP